MCVTPCNKLELELMVVVLPDRWSYAKNISHVKYASPPPPSPDHGGLGSVRLRVSSDVMANSIFPTQRTFLSFFSGEEEDEAKLLLPLELIARKKEKGREAPSTSITPPRTLKIE